MEVETTVVQRSANVAHQTTPFASREAFSTDSALAESSDLSPSSYFGWLSP